MTKNYADGRHGSDAGTADFAEAEARLLGLYRPGDPDSLRPLFALRREAFVAPPPPVDLDALNAELNRRQAIGAEPEPPGLDEAGRAELRAKAEAGDAEASYQLGRVLLRGEVSGKDEALAHLLRAADAGHARARFQAGTILCQGWGAPQDVPRGLALLEASAAAGNADAARFLALSYDGVGGHVPKDPETAMRWWREGARLGDRHASWFVGQLLLEEDPSPAGQERGLKLVIYAAEHGFPIACGTLGQLKAQDVYWDPSLVEEFAFPLLRLGAIRGDFRAACYLAQQLQRLGQPERLAEAVWWLRKAAHRDAAAARLLGKAHVYGEGVPASKEASTAWFALAAEGGDGEGAEWLARAFLGGDGVPQDPAAAIVLAERAVNVGTADGARLLGAIYDGGLGVPRDERLAAEWVARGAEMGDRTSMVDLAFLLFDGRGVAPDAAKAVAWLEKADLDEDSPGVQLFALMLFRGEGTAPDPVRARDLYLPFGREKHLPTCFTPIEDESVRFRRAATRPRDMREELEQLAADPESLSAETALEVGLLFWNGELGLVRNAARAADLFRASEQKGSALAAACLSHVFATSGEVEAEMEWLEKAASAGLAGAQRHLADRLVRNRRCECDDPRVAALLESAAANGDVLACAFVAQNLEREDPGDDPARTERVRVLRQFALEGGYPEHAL